MRMTGLVLGVAIGFVAIGIGCYLEYLRGMPGATTWGGTIGVLAAAIAAARSSRQLTV